MMMNPVQVQWHFPREGATAVTLVLPATLGGSLLPQAEALAVRHHQELRHFKPNSSPDPPTTFGVLLVDFNTVYTAAYHISETP